jgi:hypothetical protein
MMDIRTQSKLTGMIWVMMVLAIIITGIEKIDGSDVRVEAYYINILTTREESYNQKEADLKKLLMQKEEQEQQAQHKITEIKLKSGGSGANTPLPVRIGKLREKADIANILDKKLSYLQGETLVKKIEGLEETLKDTEEAKERLAQQYVEAQYNMVELKNEVGVGDTPVQVRARKLSNSLNQNATDLTEAVSTLAQELYDVPGNDLLEKINSLKKDLDYKTNALAEAQEAIVEKEEAYANLYIQHLEEKNAVQDLDAELSVIQVENSKNKEHLMDVLYKQLQK